MNVAVLPKRGVVRRVFGAGGSGKSGGGGSEAGNTLLSNATAQLIDILGEGPNFGLVDGAKSIKLDGVALQNQDDSFNFSGFQWEERIGTEDQAPVSIIDDTSIETPVGVKVVKATPITRTISEDGMDGFRVRLRFPALLSVADNGDIVGHSVSYSVLWAVAGSGTFSHMEGSPFTLTGKNNSDYFVDHDYSPPTGEAWDVRVRRESDDEISSKKSSDVYYDALAGVIKQKFIYPWSHYVAWSVDAEQFGSSIPKRTYVVRGRIISVPTNYDPVTRIYSGFWDGSFKQAWTDNPAWVLYDMAINDRYGSGLDPQDIDVVTLYEIAKYCDELVPDGFGGMEPRYTINVVINTASDAYALYNQMVSVFRGMYFWAAGQLSFSQDSPRATDVFVTPANTETGFFSYTSSADRNRPNTIYVQYADKTNGDQPDIEPVSYNKDVIERGMRLSRVTAWGCRSQGQAHRTGEWLLYTLHNDTSLIGYVAGMDHEAVKPGYIISVSDPLKSSQKRAQGRMKSVVGTTVTLDRALTLPPGNYTIGLTDRDRKIRYYTLQTFATGTSVVSTTAPVVESILPNSVWIIYDTAAGEIKYRVTSVTNKGSKRTISALQYNPSKFGYIERDLPLDAPETNQFLGGDLRSPFNFNFTPAIIDLPGAQNRVDVLFSWTYPANESRVVAFELQFADNNSAKDFKTIYKGRETSFTHPNVPGATTTKAARVRSLGANNTFSPWITISNIELFSRATAPAATTSLIATSESYGKGILVQWTLNEPKDYRYVEVWRSPTTSLGSAVLIANTRATYFRDTNLGAGDTYYYWTRVRVNTDNPDTEYSVFMGPANAVAIPPPSTDVLDGSITSAKIANAAIIADKIANDAVTSLKLAAQAVTTVKLALLAVDSTILANGAVIAAKIADAAIGITKFASGIEPVGIVAGTTVPTTKTTGVITVNGKLYRWNGTAYVLDVAAGDIVGQLISSQIGDAAVTTAKLAALAVDASKIANNAITETKILDNSISTPKILAGAIVADKIAAKAVTIEKLIMSDFTNFNENPNFADGDVSWIKAANVTIISDAARAFVGDYFMQIATSATSSITRNANIFPVIPGQTYMASAVVRAVSSPNTTLNARIRFMTADKNTLVSIVNFAAWTSSDNTYTAKTSATLTVPPGAVWAWFDLVPAATITTGAFYVGATRVQRKNAAELIVDGTIVTNHLAADSVTTNALAANSVTSAIIAAGAVTASQIAAAAITADKLAVGTASQWLENSDLSAGMTGWGIRASSNQANFTVGMRTDTYGAAPYGSIEIRNTVGYIASSYYDITPYDVNTGGIKYFAVEAGTRYQFSAYTYSHRCSRILYIGWVDATGTVLSYSPSNTVSPENGNPSFALANYSRMNVFGVAPATAVKAVVFFRHQGSGVGQPDSYAWVTHMFFGEATANQTAPSPWSQSGVTLIDAGNIVTGAIITAKLDALAVTTAKLAVGAVTAITIAANAVTAVSIAASTITGAKIAADTIGVNNMAANSITAKALILTDYENLVPNGYFSEAISTLATEYYIPNGLSANVYYVVGFATTGDKVLNVQKTDLTQSVNAELRASYAIPITGGDDYYGEIAYMTNSVVTTGAGAYYRISWYTAAMAYVTYSDVVANAPITNVMTTRSNTVTAPSTARFATVQLINHSTNSTGANWLIDRVVLRRKKAANLIVDGGITADHLAVNSVTAGAIAAGAVTATKISVTTLSAISATLGSVNISNAIIGTLTVGTSNIQAGAVTSFTTVVFPGGSLGALDGSRDITVTVNYPDPATTAGVQIEGKGWISGTSLATGGPYFAAVNLFAGGASFAGGSISIPAATAFQPLCFGLWTPPNGTTSVTMTLRATLRGTLSGGYASFTVFKR